MTLTITTRILAACADAFGVRAPDILGKDRHSTIAKARHVAAWLMRREGMSYPEIARELNQKDHTSAMHAVRVVDAALKGTETRIIERIRHAEAAMGPTLAKVDADAQASATRVA